MQEHYDLLSEIGNGNFQSTKFLLGSFGKVFKIRRKVDGKVLVCKELYYGKMSQKEKQQLVNEVNILRELNHPSIVKYYDRIIDKQNDKISIIMELCEGGDLAQIIRRCKKQHDNIAEDVIWKILTQITMGLYQCHRRPEAMKVSNGQQSGICPKILHRDLKPGNIFLDSNSNVKIGDFGLARLMNEESQFAYTHVGTPYYMSPEQINECKYNEKSDIWSLGCIIYELAALHPPFQAQNHLSLAMKIKAGKFERVPTRYSEELQRVITWMLLQNSNERPSVDDLMNLPQISLRLREKRIQETCQLIKKKEEELKLKEEKLNEKEIQLREKENQINEKEELINQILRTQDIANKNPDLIKSIQRMASTRAGDSLNISERVSIGSKLKESKNNIGTYSNGYESSVTNSRGSKVIRESSSMKNLNSSLDQTTKFQISSQQQQIEEDDSSQVTQSESAFTGSKTQTSNEQIHFYPDIEKRRKRSNNIQDETLDENASEEFQQTIFNPRPKKSSDHVLYFKRLPKPKGEKEQNFKAFDQKLPVQAKLTYRGSSVNQSQYQEENKENSNKRRNVQNEINSIKFAHLNQMVLHHIPSQETLLSKKLNDSQQNIVPRKPSKKANISINTSRGEETMTNLKTYHNLNNYMNESKKHWMNVTADLSKQLENLSFNEKKEKITSVMNKTAKRCTSHAKARPPLTDRTNLMGVQKAQSSKQVKDAANDSVQMSKKSMMQQQQQNCSTQYQYTE